MIPYPVESAPFSRWESKVLSSLSKPQEALEKFDQAVVSGEPTFVLTPQLCDFDCLAKLGLNCRENIKVIILLATDSSSVILFGDLS